ncbi:tetratricopeptide repeat protein [Blautia schinkii]|nr:tetratricopeptide repeat protein [Blautia schinkii]
MLNMNNNGLVRTRLYECSKKARTLIDNGRFEECRKMLIPLFSQYPDYAEPQNLYGLLLEAQRDHVGAMKHFRAACALDPAYLPARVNMEYFGTFDAKGTMAYNEDECPIQKHTGSLGISGEQSMAAVLTI